MLPGRQWYLPAVLIAQCVASFVLWVGYGVLRGRRLDHGREKLLAIPRARRVVAGAVMPAYGAACLLGGLWVVRALDGLGPSGLKAWAWVAVTAAGLEFVRAQMVAVAIMVAAAYQGDTPSPAESSMIQKVEEPEP